MTALMMNSHTSTSLPDWIVHADWGTSPHKRWLSIARRNEDGVFLLQAPRPVGNAASLLEKLREEAGVRAVILIGFDFPIGLPWKYACLIDQTRFLDLLPLLGNSDWPDFYRPAERPDQISIRRPFYPNKPGGSQQRYLVEGLGVDHINDLRRQCELATPDRRAAAPLFWTLGGQQVGKAAIAGWQEVLAPTVRQNPPAVQVWPFDGPLESLLIPGTTILAETYPAEFYRHLGLNLRAVPGQRNFGKRSQSSRSANAGRIFRWMANFDLALTAALASQILDGFGTTASGEDAFDAFIGVCGLLNLFLNANRTIFEPAGPSLRDMEGWILGQPPPKPND